MTMNLTILMKLLIFQKKFKLHKLKSQDILKGIVTEQLEKINFTSKGKMSRNI